MPNKNKKVRVQENITNLVNLGIIPADEAQLNIDVIYNSILDEICSVVPMNSPRQVISALRLVYGSDKKSTIDEKDVYNQNMMSTVGAVQPVDDNGYITNNVMFEAIGNEIVGSYKNIIPGTLIITRGSTVIKDDGMGNLVNTSVGSGEDNSAGKVDYRSAFIQPSFGGNNSTDTSIVKYKYDIYNIETSRNFVQFKKTFLEVFADQYQLDMDSAIVLNQFKGLNLQDNIDKILPEVLTQQIDNRILYKFFDYLRTKDENSTNDKKLPVFDATVDYGPIDVTKALSKSMTKFTEDTNVVPNVILCDPKAMSVMRLARGYIPSSMLHIDNEYTDDIEYSGTPRFVGYFDTTKVFLVNLGNNNNEDGMICITYKGPSEAQSAIIYTPFIPVTLRKVIDAMESSGMTSTTNAYSLSGSCILNPELISGIRIKVV